MTPEALVYLNEGLDYLQNHFVFREQIDWQTVYQEAYALAAEARTPQETHVALQKALERLGDPHSRFIDPIAMQLQMEAGSKTVGIQAVYPEGMVAMVAAGSAAEEAGVQVGETIEAINGQPLNAFTHLQFRAALQGEQLDLTLSSAGCGSPRLVRLQAKPYPVHVTPEGRSLTQNIGYLDLPTLIGSQEQGNSYAQTIQTLLREIDQTAPCGWVIDLRRNTGGTLWPMLAGVGPLLGEGECFSVVRPGEKYAAFYRAGQVSLEQEGVLCEVSDPYTPKQTDPAIAVLISQLTASASEYLVLAFRGLPLSRSFGEPTRGLPSGVDGKVLSDGALLTLTTLLTADRTGQTYKNGNPLLPDFPVPIDWTRLGTEDDPVLQAALHWLQKERGCL